MNKKNKIYVAGHNGLVGSAIVKTLKNKGYTNIIGKTHKELDLNNPMAVRTFFEWEKPEYVFMAAAKVGGIVANNTYRAEFIYENLMIQNNVIHQAYQSGVKKLMFLGSTCIYPRECPQPMKEEMKKRVREVEKGLKNDSTKKRLNEGEILEILGKYGITTSSPRSVVPSSPHPLFLSFLRSFVPSFLRPLVPSSQSKSGAPANPCANSCGVKKWPTPVFS